MLLFLLAATTDLTVATEPPQALQLSPPHNYLKLPPATCGKGNIDEVVVCGARDADKRYRLQSMDEQKYAEAPIRAETKLAGGTLGVAGGQKNVGGFPSNRIMLSFKIKF